MFKYQTKVQAKFHNKVMITKYSKQLRKGLKNNLGSSVYVMPFGHVNCSTGLHGKITLSIVPDHKITVYSTFILGTYNFDSNFKCVGGWKASTLSRKPAVNRPQAKIIRSSEKTPSRVHLL